MSDNRSAIKLLESQFEQARGWFEGTMQGVTEDIAHFQPEGKPSPVGAQAGHVLTGLDQLIIGAVGGKAPVMASGKETGLSEAPAGG